jgi:integrase
LHPVTAIQRKQLSNTNYVFPDPGKEGYIIEPRKQMAKVIEATGIQFTVHDLRRTFITIAESLDIPAYALKRLLNHKMNGDVTAGYIILDVERLRRPMQMISDYILRQIQKNNNSSENCVSDIKGNIINV